MQNVSRTPYTACCESDQSKSCLLVLNCLNLNLKLKCKTRNLKICHKVLFLLNNNTLCIFSRANRAWFLDFKNINIYIAYICIRGFRYITL